MHDAIPPLLLNHREGMLPSCTISCETDEKEMEPNTSLTGERAVVRR